MSRFEALEFREKPGRVQNSPKSDRTRRVYSAMMDELIVGRDEVDTEPICQIRIGSVRVRVEDSIQRRQTLLAVQDVLNRIVLRGVRELEPADVAFVLEPFLCRPEKERANRKPAVDGV